MNVNDLEIGMKVVSVALVAGKRVLRRGTVEGWVHTVGMDKEDTVVYVNEVENMQARYPIAKVFPVDDAYTKLWSGQMNKMLEDVRGFVLEKIDQEMEHVYSLLKEKYPGINPDFEDFLKTTGYPLLSGGYVFNDRGFVDKAPKADRPKKPIIVGDEKDSPAKETDWQKSYWALLWRTPQSDWCLYRQIFESHDDAEKGVGYLQESCAGHIHHKIIEVWMGADAEPGIGIYSPFRDLEQMTEGEE